MYNHKTQGARKESEEERSINPCIMHFMYLHCKLNVQKHKMKRNPSLECMWQEHMIYLETRKRARIRCQEEANDKHTCTHPHLHKTLTQQKTNKKCFREEKERPIQQNIVRLVIQSPGKCFETKTTREMIKQKQKRTYYRISEF